MRPASPLPEYLDHYHRRRSRAQRAYIARQKSRTTSLTDEVEVLSYELARLEGRRDVLSEMLSQSIAMNETRSERLMREYVHMFAHGFHLHDAAMAGKQERFLRAIMDPAMVFQGFYSLDTFIRIFQRHSSTISSFVMRFVSCDVVLADGDKPLACTLRLAVQQRMTRASLALYFPHILHDEVLVQELIGHTMEIPQTMDLAAALAKVLRSLERATFVLDSGRLPDAPPEHPL
ncbi:hypothetical protein SPRG_11640 [Saprolegnia parasitica CBS 223.65]|uniref:BZIP domain-containing protein n=1 Tax=Saprolegnia parasitica (strain CBS 223.65) TaxID=695850 RepID=A0A067C9W2_SAPPC|nr:hypothetical protein SPRG_11640 [Saprolegnia parasitica CBS 223.65]KDO23326.1 hypothetical protein SPRG_11640 [Saprolegnia parasitica CBS 223.65]|eukprot:XP_012205978.1 hypothetical protein SPRG_11640 [Saprolegnia parasitica CBS 223.65]